MENALPHTKANRYKPEYKAMRNLLEFDLDFFLYVLTN
mgnify:CR=1 FL=1